MKKYIYVEADYNDGDYTSRLSEITDEEIELIRPVIKAIGNNGGDYRTQDCVYEGAKSSEELYGDLKNFDLFDEYTPSSEYGIHTITEIKIVQILEELY